MVDRTCRRMDRPFGEFCGAPATHGSVFGARCEEHAEELVQRLQNQDTLISLLKRPLSEKEARARVWRLQ